MAYGAQPDGTVTLSQGVTVTFGGVFDSGDVVASQVTATGTKTWTYKNEFQITENAEGVTVVYYGNISVSTALPINSKDIAIMSYAGNINTTALTATNITLMAQKGTVTTGAVMTANNFVVFNDGSVFALPVGSVMNGDLLINQTLRFPDDFPAANTTNNLMIASLSMSGNTCTLSISGGGTITATSSQESSFDNGNGKLINDGNTITLSYIGNITFQNNVDFKNTGYNLVINAGGNLTALAIDVSTGGNTGQNAKNDSQGRNLFLNARGTITTNDLYTAGGFSGSAQNTDAGDVTIKAGGAANVTYLNDIVASDNNGAGMGGGYTFGNASGIIHSGNGGSIDVISGAQINVIFQGAITSTSFGGAGLAGGGTRLNNLTTGSNLTVYGGVGGSITTTSYSDTAIVFQKAITSQSYGGAGLGGGCGAGFVAPTVAYQIFGGMGGFVNAISNGVLTIDFQALVVAQAYGGAGLAGGGAGGSIQTNIISQATGGNGGSINAFIGKLTNITFSSTDWFDMGGTGLSGGAGHLNGGSGGSIQVTSGDSVELNLEQAFLALSGHSGYGYVGVENPAIVENYGGMGGSILVISKLSTTILLNKIVKALSGGNANTSFALNKATGGNGGSVVVTAGSFVNSLFQLQSGYSSAINGGGAASRSANPIGGSGGSFVFVASTGLSTQLDTANAGVVVGNTGLYSENTGAFKFVLLNCDNNTITPITQTFAGTTGANETLAPTNNTSTQTIPDGYIAGYDTSIYSFVLTQILTDQVTIAAQPAVENYTVSACAGSFPKLVVDYTNPTSVVSQEWYYQLQTPVVYYEATSSLAVIPAIDAGNYVVLPTNDQGLTFASHPVAVNFDAVPTITLTTSDVQVVSGQSITLQANSNCDVFSWEWFVRTNNGWRSVGTGETLTVRLTKNSTFKAVTNNGDAQQVTVTVYTPSSGALGLPICPPRCRRR